VGEPVDPGLSAKPGVGAHCAVGRAVRFRPDHGGAGS
jgi:hypothetical protein